MKRCKRLGYAVVFTFKAINELSFTKGSQNQCKNSRALFENLSNQNDQSNQWNTLQEAKKRFGASLRRPLNSRSFTGERNLNFVLIETVNGSDAILQHQKSSVIEMKRVRQARLVDNSVLKGIT